MFERSFGTETAFLPRRRLHRSAAPTPRLEALIRTLGVSLVAIAAVVASLTLVRQRPQERKPGEGMRLEPFSPAAVDLDQLRAAGL